MITINVLNPLSPMPSKTVRSILSFSLNHQILSQILIVIQCLVLSEQNAPLGVVCIANLNHVLLLYKLCPLPILSVNFDNAVNFSDKPITGKEPNRSCEQEETKDHDACVAEIQKG